MFFFNSFILITGFTLIKILRTLPLNNETQIVLDQRQTGKYNIHLSIKDVSIIEIGGNNYEEYSDSDDYYYDDALLTIKPWGLFTKPTTARPSFSNQSTSSPIIYVTPIGENFTANHSNNSMQHFLINNTNFDGVFPVKQLNNSKISTNTVTHNIQLITENETNFDYVTKSPGFRASQRDPFDFIHRRKAHQKPESRIINFKPYLRTGSKRNGKNYNCNNVSDKLLCQMRKQINSLFVNKLFDWVQRYLPNDNDNSLHSES